MIKKTILSTVLTLACGFYSYADNGELVTFDSLLKEMSDESTLAQWPEKKPFVLKQASSYSRESKTATTARKDALFRPESGRDWGQGWYENHDFANFIREEVTDGRTEYVMMEDDGPGAIVRLWTTYGGKADNPGGIYRIYIDGQKEPVIELKNKDMMGGEALIGQPYSFMTAGPGRNLYMPIPYAKSCKMTYESLGGSDWDGNYYVINYRKYDPSVVVESFTKDTINQNKEQLATSADLLTGKTENSTCPSEEKADKSGVLKAGKTLSLDLSGTRAITDLRVRLAAADIEQALRSTVLEITFDGEKTVWCPVGQFFGVGYRQAKNESFYISTDEEGNMESRWVMPFAKSAKVTLHNYGKQDVDVQQFELASREYKWDKNSMYFHASWDETKGVSTDKKSDYNFVKIKGRGVFVGDNLTIFNTVPNWWGEGDEKIFVDGEKFPSHFGTGSEDYYGYAWCHPGVFLNFPVTQPIGAGNNTPNLSTNNRYRLLDGIPFEKSLQFDMEIWHQIIDIKMNYSPATFWYAFKGATWNNRENVTEVKKAVAKSKDDVNAAK